jgi:transposase
MRLAGRQGGERLCRGSEPPETPGRFTATSEGHFAAVRWTGQWPARMWALEDCRHLTRRLERDLLGAGERVVRVPTQLMADALRGGRRRGKSDPIDAEAVALRRCGTRICRPRSWMGPRGRSSCSLITATTW